MARWHRSEAALGPERLWVAGYCNQVFGYLPAARIVAEGGHETVRLVEETGLFAAEAQDVVVATVRRLAARAGRPWGTDPFVRRQKPGPKPEESER